MEQKTTQDTVTRVGYVAADAKTKSFESGKNVTNVTILSGSDENKKATYIRGWNAMADKLKDIKTGEKWEFKGALNVETNGDRSFDVLTAKEAYPHVKMEIRGEVRHVEDKKLGKTDMKNIMVSSSEMQGGREVSEVYNIELYGERNMAKGKGIEVGDVVSTKGHVRMYSYMKDGQTITNKAFQNPYEIKNHTREHLAEMKVSADSEKSKGPKASQTKVKAKPKGKGLGI